MLLSKRYSQRWMFEVSGINARDVALARIESLESSHEDSIVLSFVRHLVSSYNNWLVACCKQTNTSVEYQETRKDACSVLSNEQSSSIIADAEETTVLRCALQTYAQLVKTDPTLGEELALEGSHVSVLSPLMRIDASRYSETEEDDDAIMELQDLAGEIAALSPSFPIRYAPYTSDELSRRLPLVFDLSPVLSQPEEKIHRLDSKTSTKSLKTLIHQVTDRQSAQEDVGFVMWPSAVILSRWLLSNPEILSNKTVLELGAGCGLVGLVCASIPGVSKVILTDFNSMVLKNIDRNIELNKSTSQCSDVSTQKLDFYQQLGKKGSSFWIEGSTDRECEQVDVIVAADIICKRSDALAAAKSIHDVLKDGGEAFVVLGDSKHRFGVDAFATDCANVGLEVHSTSVSELYGGELLDRDALHQTCGYIDEMKLNMYHVVKRTL